MGKVIERLKKRKKALNVLSAIFEEESNIFTIHYSCESFYDRTNGSSPRVTSIAARNLGSGQSYSFSIHQFAEISNVKFEDIVSRYDELEQNMLKSFYDFVNQHISSKWVHWNMRDSNYGFQAIAHRYMVLGGKPIVIHEFNKIDLARLFKAIYGEEYIDHPRMTKILEHNPITKKDYLGGEEEAKAFESKKYYKLHLSTLRKFYLIACLAERANNNTLKTNASFRDKYGSLPVALGELIKENWLFSIIGFLLALLGVISFFI